MRRVRRPRLRLRLSHCLDLHEQRTGERPTYGELATRAGVSLDTVKSIATRPAYNATLRTVERLCTALGVAPADLLDWSS